jgi:mannose-6-phosphate isomerase
MVGGVGPGITRRPLPVAVRPVWRPYIGGDLVRRFRRAPSSGDDHWTEEWIGSLISAGNPDPNGHVQGLTVVTDEAGNETTLRNLVASYPEAMLGPDFVERFGATTGFLVKIISLGQVGPVHVHPSAVFAGRHLDTPHGQAEAWIILGQRDDAASGVQAGAGFRPDVRREDLVEAIEERSSEAMRGLLDEFAVHPSEAVLVRPGVPHYLGEGPIFIEVQQPSDFSVVPEYWSIGAAESDGALGLGWDMALDAFDWPDDQSHEAEQARQQPRTVMATAQYSEVALIEPAAAGLFDVRSIRVAGEWDVPAGRFSVTVITGGDGTISGDWGQNEVHAGDILVMPAAVDHRFVAGRSLLQVHRCMGPAVQH